MRILPVIDLREGLAHHARGGDRSHYRPLVSQLLRPSGEGLVAPTALAVAQAFRSELGLSEIYVADLDAIDLGKVDSETYQDLREGGFRVWLDAGVDSMAKAHSISSHAHRMILGLESLPGHDFLKQLVAEVDLLGLAFSLDLRGGRPLIAQQALWPTDDPCALAEIAIEAGVRRVILLDLARVGSNAGTGTESLLCTLAQRFPEVEWIVGGGFATVEQIADAASLGASAALVGSALHDGRIGRPEIERLAPALSQPFHATDLSEGLVDFDA